MTPNYHKITFGTNVPNVVRQLLQQRCVTCCGLSGGTVCYNYHDFLTISRLSGYSKTLRQLCRLSRLQSDEKVIMNYEYVSGLGSRCRYLLMGVEWG
jgi:hypothetical protein